MKKNILSIIFILMLSIFSMNIYASDGSEIPLEKPFFNFRFELFSLVDDYDSSETFYNEVMQAYINGEGSFYLLSQTNLNLVLSQGAMEMKQKAVAFCGKYATSRVSNCLYGTNGYLSECTCYYNLDGTSTSSFDDCEEDFGCGDWQVLENIANGKIEVKECWYTNSDCEKITYVDNERTVCFDGYIRSGSSCVAEQQQTTTTQTTTSDETSTSTTTTTGTTTQNTNQNIFIKIWNWIIGLFKI